MKFLLKRGIIAEGSIEDAVPSITMVSDTSQLRTAITTDVTITNIQKVGGRSVVQVDDIDADEYDLVIVDEAHHYPAPIWKQLIDHFPNSKRVFLTATPFRSDALIIRQSEYCYSLARQQRRKHHTIFFKSCADTTS